MTDSQKDFEIWAREKGMNLTKSSDGTYVYNPAFYAFMGWTESREASTHTPVQTTQTVSSLDMNDI